MSHTSHPSRSNRGFCMRATIAWGTRSWDLETLVDSGVEANFLDQDLVAKLGIPMLPLTSPVEAVSLSGGLIAHVSHSTKPLRLTISGNHSESISFNLISSPQTPLV